MIQANELRIGNWVAFGTVPCQINSIHTVPGIKESHIRVKGFVDSNPAYCFYIEQVDPIPLNHELLEGNGFLKLTYGYVTTFIRQFDTEPCHLYLDKLKEDPKDMWYFKIATPSGSVAVNNIYSIHQLQNLYFALTGTELNVQL